MRRAIILVFVLAFLAVGGIALARVWNLADRQKPDRGQAPAIESISPLFGPAGTLITIRGSGFGGIENDVGFRRVGADRAEGGHDGYVTGLTSADGLTLSFVLPKETGVCPLSTMGPDQACIMLAMSLDAGLWDVFVVNRRGQSNTVRFIIAQNPSLKP